ncbi:uncharacterized protein PHACADRAFT_260805 [Phanerochaete carnosa HHB-10118-sp]|uniref:Acyl-coenzyme A oxidase n=1 Tax=Phanerochaete carnosa (strain HHB-10118-sp) TaxID=650164 RepID=K5WQ10_PHACS|nr:uncharacterized protein PHACADRAFT_260805 [Phanerochaete carnosa HHB-10118-sp]EKM52427.1 hypothetical protein PHACADRAFT_260805 [Phanerochaete carnosa HHB-10118-sp]
MAERSTPEKQARIDMQRAREQSEVDTALVRDFAYGGQARWEEHAHVVDLLSKDPTFDHRYRVYLTRKERFKESLKLAKRMHDLQDKHGWTDAQFRMAMENVGESSAYSMHYVAFEPVLRSQASDELLAEYGALIANRGLLGCYLQTELAHGTNVGGLETTATYVPESKEFVINSPTFTSRKWWIGAAGKLATHGVVSALLILPDGKNMGPHLFFVQLRSLDDHRTLPGITLGDIGPKVFGGFSTIDNGYAVFDHVRIPRYYMLSKFAQVTEDGHYRQPPHSKISYGGMLYIRSTMVTGGGWTAAKAATIAIRYATVRRQGSGTPQGLEEQIINYPAVYNRLLPVLSRAYVLLLLGRHLEKAFSAMNEGLARGDTSLLADMHATTSGLKVLVTTAVAQDIETARRALGGHGFSDFSGLGKIYANYIPTTTFEGDNYVLDLQVVRAAVKAYKRYASAPHSDPSTLPPTARYLRLLSEQSAADKATAGWTDPHTSVHLLEQRAAHMIREYAKHENDLDASAPQRVSRAATEAFVAVQVESFIQELPSQLPDKDAHILKDLLTLYLLVTVEGALADLLSFGVFPDCQQTLNGDPTGDLRRAIKRLELKLLPQAIGLTDAFGFTDWELGSALGVYNGAVYEALWDSAQTEPQNQTDVVDGYQEYIKPVLERGRRLAGRSGAKL